MSGIVGMLSLNGGAGADRAALQSMLAGVAHRGPDAEGLWLKGPVGLGHRQLRTTPESLNEVQPLASAGEEYAITCDGRVDNRGDLIQALRDKAPVGTESSDAHLVLHSYITWGPDCLKHIIGDFAFAIWDGRRQQLFCARDPMGIRTLYYYKDHDRFVFASDIKAVMLGAGIPGELNQFLVALYLIGKFNEAEQTFFKDIFQALPARYILVSRDTMENRVYWEADPWSQIRYRKTEEYVDHLREVFNQSVQCRLRTISPVGVSLSGGLDSTSLACAAAHLIKEGKAPGVDLQAFSSVFKEFSSVDESEYISKVLQRWQVPGHNLYADKLWGFKPPQNPGRTLNWPYPVPFQARHETRLSCAAELGVRVMLTGEGGDELLNPGIWYFVDLLHGLRWSQLRKELKCVTPGTRRSFRNTVYGFYKTAAWRLMPGPAQQLYRRAHPRLVPEWLSEEFIRGSGALEYEAVRPQYRSISLYRQSQYNGCISLPRLPFLPYIAEMHAHYAMEPRHPFLDRRMIEFLTRVPPELKFSGGFTKLLLRQAMEGLLPDEVRLRIVKSHFGDVLSHGIRQERSRIQSRLEEGYLVRQGWLEEQGIKTLFDRFLAGVPGLNSYLVAMVTLEDWLSSHFDSNGGGDLASSSPFAPESRQERR